MASLDTAIAYFRKRQAELAKKHHGKFVLIHSESLDGVFDSELEAYMIGKKKYAAGTFLIRQCLRPEEETAQVFHSRVAI